MTYACSASEFFFKAVLFISDYNYYPRRARSALGVDTVLTLDVCMFVCMLGL